MYCDKAFGATNHPPENDIFRYHITQKLPHREITLNDFKGKGDLSEDLLKRLDPINKVEFSGSRSIFMIKCLKEDCIDIHHYMNYHDSKYFLNRDDIDKKIGLFKKTEEKKIYRLIGILCPYKLNNCECGPENTKLPMRRKEILYEDYNDDDDDFDIEIFNLNHHALSYNKKLIYTALIQKNPHIKNEYLCSESDQQKILKDYGF